VVPLGTWHHIPRRTTSCHRKKQIYRLAAISGRATTDAHADRRAVGGCSIDVQNPLSVPYRTGNYLVYDVTAGSEKDPENFRSAWSLDAHPYPASGSHQLDHPQLVETLKSKVIQPYRPRDLFLVCARRRTVSSTAERRPGTRTTTSATSGSHPR
jgi:hypothetical protein